MDIKKMFNYDVLQLGNSAGVYGTTTGCSLGTGIGQIALGLFGYGFNTDYSSNYNCCFEGYNPSSTLKSDLVSFGIVGAAALAAGIISGLANNSGIGRIQNNGASELRDEIKSKEAEAETELAKIGAGVTRGDYQTTLDTQINTLNNQANIENKIANNKASLDVANSEFQTISNNVLAFQESIKNKKDGIQVLFEECQNLEKTLNNDKLPEPAKIAVKSQLDAKKADGKKLCEEKAALEIQLQEAETKKSEKEAQVNNLKAEQENLIAQKNDNEE